MAERCPNCGGDGVGGIQPVCCRRPNRNGECCGDPEPEQYPCLFCRGTGQLEYYESAARPSGDGKGGE